jgi:hypothetical protein
MPLLPCGSRWKGSVETYGCMADEDYNYGRSNNMKVRASSSYSLFRKAYLLAVTLSKYFVTCSSEKRKVRRAR